MAECKHGNNWSERKVLAYAAFPVMESRTKSNAQTWELTWGMYSNNGVKNKRAQPIMIPVTIPDKPDFAPLSWFTADLEKEPTKHIEQNSVNLSLQQIFFW